MTEVIGNSAIDLLERENRKGLHDRFRGIALPEAPDDGVESHPRPCHPVHLVVVFDIRTLLHGYRPSQCGHLSISVSAHYTGTSHASHKLTACKVAQFIAVCRRSKWSKHMTNSPFLALRARVGSNAARKMSSACSNALC